MGNSRSEPKVTRPQVKTLTKKFQKMSESLDTLLPWTTFARNGAAVLMIAGAAFMLTAATTLYSHGGRVAGALVALALCLHLPSFVRREWFLIPRIEELWREFFMVVPDYTDTSNVPTPRRDTAAFFLLLLEVGFVVVGFVEAPWGLCLVSSLVLGVSAFAYVRKILRDGNDLPLKVACQVSSRILGTLLKSSDENV